ncbi:MAG: DUF4136 domain-containing protein [Bdellovibrio sp.]|nr:DUF4136 domain-containing protein [Bdellovibrio sp.]
MNITTISYNFIFLFFISVFISCSVIDVKQDYDVKYDFSKLKNYSWQVMDEKSPVVRNALVEDRVRTAVDNQLSAQGFKKDGIDKVDFFVNYHYIVREVSDKDVMNAGFGIGSTLGSDSTFGSLGFGIPLGDRASHMVESLVIDVIDANSGKLIWRGFANEKLLNSTPEKTNANFIKTVQAILQKFPPSKKKK